MAVLRLVAQGVDNKDFAQALNYSVYTVASRLCTIYEKLCVTNRTRAARYALSHGPSWTSRRGNRLLPGLISSITNYCSDSAQHSTNLCLSLREKTDHNVGVQ
jgi:DNA-binding CsgD family transcriptional regulator